jgi:hypothetical protein
MKLRSLLFFTAVASLVACGSPNDEPTNDDGASDSSEEEMRASCTNPRRYFAAMGEDGCKPIEGRRGQWVPEALFSDAPPEVSSTTCTYVWKGEKYSRPDRDAIVMAAGWQKGVAPACGASQAPEIGELQPIPNLDVFGQAGAVGCDVCGVLRKDGKIWVVLPPDKITTRQFQVNVSDGTTRAFQIRGSAAAALSMKLPALAPGLTYRPGNVQLY